jgi:hypothetical protein
MPVSAAAKAMPMSRKDTQGDLPLPFAGPLARVPEGIGSAFSFFIMSNTASPGAGRPFRR